MSERMRCPSEIGPATVACGTGGVLKNPGFFGMKRLQKRRAASHPHWTKANCAASANDVSLFTADCQTGISRDNHGYGGVAGIRMNW